MHETPAASTLDARRDMFTCGIPPRVFWVAVTAATVLCGCTKTKTFVQEHFPEKVQLALTDRVLFCALTPPRRRNG